MLVAAEWSVAQEWLVILHFNHLYDNDKKICLSLGTVKSIAFLLVGAHRVGVVFCAGFLAEVNARQFDDRSRLPERVADEKVEVGTVLAEPIVR